MKDEVGDKRVLSEKNSLANSHRSSVNDETWGRHPQTDIFKGPFGIFPKDVVKRFRKEVK